VPRRFERARDAPRRRPEARAEVEDAERRREEASLDELAHRAGALGHVAREREREARGKKLARRAAPFVVGLRQARDHRAEPGRVRKARPAPRAENGVDRLAPGVLERTDEHWRAL
jgi:hypothetical protein